MPSWSRSSDDLSDVFTADEADAHVRLLPGRLHRSEARDATAVRPVPRLQRRAVQDAVSPGLRPLCGLRASVGSAMTTGRDLLVFAAVLAVFAVALQVVESCTSENRVELPGSS